MGNSGKAQPSRAWYVLPIILVLASALLAGVGFLSFLRFVRTDFRAYQPESSVSVSSDGFTLYARDGTTGPDDLSCTATGPNATVQLRPVSGRSTVGNGQGTFVAIASTPPDLPAGTYLISCVSASGMDVPLYLGPRFDLGSVGRLVVFNIVTPLLLGFGAVVLFVILAVMRYRRRPVKVPPV